MMFKKSRQKLQVIKPEKTPRAQIFRHYIRKLEQLTYEICELNTFCSSRVGCPASSLEEVLPISNTSHLNHQDSQTLTFKQ